MLLLFCIFFLFVALFLSLIPSNLDLPFAFGRFFSNDTYFALYTFNLEFSGTTKVLLKDLFKLESAYCFKLLGDKV